MARVCHSGEQTCFCTVCQGSCILDGKLESGNYNESGRFDNSTHNHKNPDRMYYLTRAEFDSVVHVGLGWLIQAGYDKGGCSREVWHAWHMCSSPCAVLRLFTNLRRVWQKRLQQRSMTWLMCTHTCSGPCMLESVPAQHVVLKLAEAFLAHPQVT